MQCNKSFRIYYGHFPLYRLKNIIRLQLLDGYISKCCHWHIQNYIGEKNLILDVIIKRSKDSIVSL